MLKEEYNKQVEDSIIKLMTILDAPRKRVRSKGVSFTIKVKFRIKFSAEMDINYWALLPCINLNFHFPELEFEWLCFGFYIVKL